MQFHRSDGVFLHVSSLPGPHGIGDLGDGAREFLSFLGRAGVDYWQICPLGPTFAATGDSPYQSYSAFAGNPLFVSLDRLAADGWLVESAINSPPAFDRGSVEYDRVREYKHDRLRAAFERFEETATEADRGALEAFCEREPWLDNYVLFRALTQSRPEDMWTEWPAPLRDRDPDALETAHEEHEWEVRYRQFVQWQFDRQWRALREEADAHGVRILGDVPIYVALDSADVWAAPEAFQLDASNRPTAVAGVPPNPGDDGQIWGNPLYDWAELAETDYDWWIERFRRVLDLCDAARLDHFLGFVQYWAVPEGADHSSAGEWREGPGADLFETVAAELGETPFIAEDLGFVDDRMETLCYEFGFPGMRVTQHADWCREGDPHQPMHFPQSSVGYTSTHDTDTWVGYYEDLSTEQRDCLHYNLGVDGEQPIEWAIIDAVWRSEAILAVTTLSDLLGRGSEARFNTPGTLNGNWTWRVEAELLSDELADRLRNLGDVHVR